MARRSEPRRRAAWKRGLDLLVVGAAALAGLLIADGSRAVRASHGPGTARGRRATPPSREASSAGYETEDMSGRTMTLLAIGLAASATAAIGGGIGMLLLIHARTSGPVLTVEQQARIEPPAPHLQAHPQADLRDLRARETQLLHGYAWLDPQHSAARVPIERAMALSAGRSLDPAP